jgi:Family of unknown function (DUF5317)
VVLALLLLVGAACLARASGGSLTALSTVRLRGTRLVAFAVVAQLLGVGLARLTGVSGFYPAGLVVSALAALAFCARNLRVVGLPLVTTGLVLNALVVVANGSMPVSATAAARAGVSIRQIASGEDPRHSVARAATTWRILGDVIPVPLPVRPEVVSPGDMLVAAGLAELVFLGMRRRPRRDSPNRRDPAAVALS